MKRTTDSKKKYLMLISVLMLMLVLCGCRSRLTNNTDVVATINDEDGYLTEEYEMRRYDLDSPVAQKPLFTGWGSGDDDSYDYADDGSFDNYDDTYDDGWDESDDFSDTTDDDTSDTASPTPGSSTTTTRPSLPSRQSTTTTGNIIVTLDPNGGSVTPTSIRVSKNSTYSGLPVANRKGYDFQGWYTEKEDGKGSKVMSSTKVTKSTAHTLYAHWKESENDAEKVTITLDLNDGHGTKKTKKVAKNTTFGKVLPKPESVEWGDMVFVGWFTKKTGGSEIDPKKKITKNTTVYAHWKASDQPKEEKDYDVTLDLDGGKGDTSIRVKDGRYPDPLPTPTKDGSYFKGWYIGNDKVEGGQESRGKTPLTAKWESYEDHWKNRYDEASNNKDFNTPFYANNSDADLVKGVRKKKLEEVGDSDYVFISIDDYDDFDENKDENRQALRSKYPNGTIVLIPSCDDNGRRVYRLILLRYLYENSSITDEDILDAARDLGVELPDLPYYKEIPAGA
ncbi:MAG: InlB B-repeat-containing protein [Mogibacterium sp.]|nr:InlB B-repeat-containing protein [Mogibacterium sp.]